MARRRSEEDGTESRVRRQVGRLVANASAVIVSLVVIGAWLASGFYVVEPGEAAVILFLGKYDRTETSEGWNVHWPPPLSYHTNLNVRQVRQETFGPQSGEAGGEAPGDLEYTIQTGDSNMVSLGFAVQYQIADAFAYLFGLADARAALRDASMAAVREVVGTRSVDDVLTVGRIEVQTQAREIVQQTLDDYLAVRGFEPAFDILSVDLQDVQPPAPVKDAFDDVVSAQQDEKQSLSRARGDAEEISARARAEATELVEASLGYKEAVILEARGEAERFLALYEEYRRAPEVTRRRLYLETMEKVLPEVDKLVVERDTVQILPWLAGPGARPAPVEETR